jgi:two-component system sensor kinase FixL
MTMPAGTKARELLEHISEGFVFVDEQFRIREMNAEASRIVGRPTSHYLGRTLWEAWPTLAGREFERLVRHAMVARTPFSLEHLSAWPNGREAWFEVRAVPADQGLAIFYRDISAQKSSEEQLRRAQYELMHAERLSAMGTMAATLAHELAQPLTSASNYVETSERLLRSPSSDQVREARSGLNMASLAVGRAREILARIRAFVAKEPIDSKVHDLRLIVADASILVLPKAQRDGVEIAFDLDPRPQWVRVDAVQVQQVLVNLIRNAIEAMREAQGKRRIKIASAIVSTRWVEVSVDDSGPGFDADEVEALFHPFQTSKADGLGIGLSISKTIIEAHEGTITAEPSPDGGARFRFTLPRTVGPG